MTLEEIQAKLGQLGELSSEDLEQLHLAVVGELANFEEGPENGTAGYPAAVGHLNALQIAAEKVGFAIERGRLVASAESVTASGANGRGSAVHRMAARRSAPKMSPEATPAESGTRAVLTASGSNLADLPAGHEFANRMDLAEAMTRTLERLPRNGPERGKILVASARWHYPEDRQLDGENVLHNERIFANAAPKNALVATGGVCLPVNVDYSVPTFATPERPLRDALPAFGAGRGGLRFIQPPDIAGATGLGAGGGLKGGTGVWTEATDLSPGASTKPIVTIACGTEQLVYVDAVSTRLGFGNMQARFAPEQIAANTDVAMAAAASVAEQNLLNKIAGSCTQSITAPPASTGLGAARDFVSGLAESVAAYRDAHRISDETSLTAILPRWLRHLIRADFAREIGHGQSGDWNSLILSDEDIDAIFEPFGVTPVWHLDGQPTSAPGLGSAVNQYFVIQTGSANILTFPSKVVWYLFVEGTMQFLDGGRLDLGVVRDSTMDAVNDFELMVETFESVAFRGVPGAALQVISTISATGASTGTVSAPPAA